MRLHKTQMDASIFTKTLKDAKGLYETPQDSDGRHKTSQDSQRLNGTPLYFTRLTGCTTYQFMTPDDFGDDIKMTSGDILKAFKGLSSTHGIPHVSNARGIHAYD